MNDVKDIIIEENVSLKKFNTYKIDSKVKYLIRIKSLQGLKDIIKILKDKQIDYFMLGAGSNVIFDDYFRGALIKLDGLKSISREGNLVKVEAGAMMGELTKFTVDNNLTGLEWAINIPGTVGGSINNNAGAYNSEIFDKLVSIKVLDNDLEIKELKKEEIIYNYRSTNIKDLNLIVLEATFLLEEGNKEESLRIIKDRATRRMKSQPLDMPSAGSVFRNPSNDFAGRLIEEAGLKGKKIGGAEISGKHANFIVNTGNATSNDIKSLIKLVHDEIKNKYNIDLVVEQEILEWK